MDKSDKYLATTSYDVLKALVDAKHTTRRVMNQVAPRVLEASLEFGAGFGDDPGTACIRIIMRPS